MARIPLGDQVSVGLAVANVDAKYGPYSSVQKAFEDLGEDGDDVLAVGLTIGVTQSDGSVKEYWLEKKAGSDFAASDFVEKGGSSISHVLKDVDFVAPSSSILKLKKEWDDDEEQIDVPIVSQNSPGVMTPSMYANLPNSIAVNQTTFEANGGISFYSGYTDVYVTED